MRQASRVSLPYVSVGGRVLVLCGAVVAALLMAGCNSNDIMGLGEGDQIKLGQQAGDQFESKYGLSSDTALKQLVSRIGQKIAAQAKPPNYDYDYRVLANDEVNANAFPGGRIYVWTGLTNAVKRNPDQLAFVIAHETAHVARGHTAQAIKRQMGTDMAVALLLGGKDAAKYAGLVTDLVLRGYGRTAEYEADRVGLQLAQAAGYDPTAAYAVIHEFQKLGGDKDPSQVELIFDSHPGDNSRIAALQAEIKRNGWRGKYTP